MGEKNMEKHGVYQSMTGNLAKALRAEFYYQAIFIEYAILEDRCCSALRHAGVKHLDSKGHALKLNEKLKKLRGNPAFQVPYVRQRITEALLDALLQWKRQRDLLIHDLAKIPYDHEAVKAIAITGNDLIRQLSAKVRSVNTYHDRQREQSSSGDENG